MAQNSENFKSQNELFIRLLPAIETKISEIRREKIYNIEPIDIWNYCVVNKWKNKKNLRMYELVDDILNLDVLNVEIFIRKNNNDRKD